MTHFNANIRFIDQFLAHFKPMFTNTQMSALKATVYGMFYDYKRLSLSAISKKTHTSYQKLQYFFSDSDWDIKTLNDIRLSILQNQPTTRATPNGIMAIDDTGCPKPYAQKTEGAQYQHCGSLGREEICNVAVASCFVSDSKHFPVNFKSYIPEDQCKPHQFKSKLDLAKDLIDHAIEKNIPFKYIAFDSWYSASDLIEFIESKGKYIVADVKLNRSILWTDPVTKQRIYKRVDEIAPMILKHFVHRLKHVEIPQANGKIKHPLTFTFQSKLKDCSTPLQIFFIFDKFSDSDDKDMHVLITNDLTLPVQSAIFTYLLRWGIEESFRELKDNFCFDQYQVRDQEQIQRHWILSFLVWSLTYWIKQNACLSKILTDCPNSIGQCKEAVASLIIIDSQYLLSKNPNAAQLLKIKSQRFKERLQN
jgi:DDE superfamily endonuclease